MRGLCTMQTDGTIIALASATGRSDRCIIRASGIDAHVILHRCVNTTKSYSKTFVQNVAGVYQARFLFGLPCIIYLYNAPHSFTGEDSFEIQIPGNSVLIDRVIATLINAGGHQAGPGEFTARAFMNHKLSLSEAEGVMATITAKSDAQLRAANALADGRFGRIADHVATDLTQLLGLVEAGIDFTDQEDVVAISKSDLASSIVSIQDTIRQTLERAVGAERLSAIPAVVLAGSPNSGKSTLFNMLLGRTRSVVSGIEGTTRDVLAEPMHLDPDDPLSSEVLLVDVAGLNGCNTDTMTHHNYHTYSEIESQMQDAAKRAITQADLVLYLSTSGQSHTQHDDVLHSYDGPVINIRSKVDSSGVENEINTNETRLKSDKTTQYICVSGKTGYNIRYLRSTIAKTLQHRICSLSSDALALLPRHEEALQTTLRFVSEAHALIVPDIRCDWELVAATLRFALDAIGKITGEITPDEVLDEVFGKFCVGK